MPKKLKPGTKADAEALRVARLRATIEHQRTAVAELQSRIDVSQTMLDGLESDVRGLVPMVLKIIARVRDDFGYEIRGGSVAIELYSCFQAIANSTPAVLFGPDPVPTSPEEWLGYPVTTAQVNEEAVQDVAVVDEDAEHGDTLTALLAESRRLEEEFSALSKRCLTLIGSSHRHLLPRDHRTVYDTVVRITKLAKHHIVVPSKTLPADQRLLVLFYEISLKQCSPKYTYFEASDSFPRRQRPATITASAAPSATPHPAACDVSDSEGTAEVAAVAEEELDEVATVENTMATTTGPSRRQRKRLMAEAKKLLRTADEEGASLLIDPPIGLPIEVVMGSVVPHLDYTSIVHLCEAEMQLAHALRDDSVWRELWNATRLQYDPRWQHAKRKRLAVVDGSYRNRYKYVSGEPPQQHPKKKACSAVVTAQLAVPVDPVTQQGLKALQHVMKKHGKKLQADQRSCPHKDIALVGSKYVCSDCDLSALNTLHLA